MELNNVIDDLERELSEIEKSMELTLDKMFKIPLPRKRVKQEPGPAPTSNDGGPAKT